MQGQYISICTGTFGSINYVSSVSKMILEHYDTEEYANTIFIVNTSVMNAGSLKKTFKRIIYYNLEHYEFWDKQIIVNDAIDSIRECNCTEVWDFEINNLEYYKSFNLDIPVYFKPLRYTSLVSNPVEKPENPKFTLGFVGCLSDFYHDHRRIMFNDIHCAFAAPILRDLFEDISIATFIGKDIIDLLPELNNCKFVLDTMSQKPAGYVSQNQVRIFEHIIYGHHVVSEKISGINYFPGLITQFDYPTDDEIKTQDADIRNRLESLLDVIKNIQPQDFSAQYKEMTYTDEAYENYRNQLIQQYINITQ